MTDIELVIKISEDSYEATCNGSMLPPDVKNVINAIRNGTLLPKGHGDLIDRKKLGIAPIDSTDLPLDRCLMVYLAEDVDGAPAIIEADKGEQE